MTEQTLDRLRALTDSLLDPELFRQILDSLPVALLVVDSQGIIQMVNGQLELLFGYPRTALLGKNFDMLLPENIRDRHLEHVRDYFAEPHVRPHNFSGSARRPMNLAQDLTGLKRDGSIIMLRISLGPLVNESGVWALAVITRASGE